MTRDCVVVCICTYDFIHVKLTVCMFFNISCYEMSSLIYDGDEEVVAVVI